MKRILVCGALGQLGSELVPALRQLYSTEHVIASDVRGNPNDANFIQLDLLSANDTEALIADMKIDTIFNLPAILSATAESKPDLAWNLNVTNLISILNIATKHKVAVFTPSSIAAFGPSSKKNNAPQTTVMQPNTWYGISKYTGELIANYYHQKYGLDTRGLRYPGIISYKTKPGGGTTDYAVDMIGAAVKKEFYRCPLNEGSRIEMMYYSDAINAAIQLMEARKESLRIRNSYNVVAFSFTPQELYNALKVYFPTFEMVYEIDPIKQAIADSWPNTINDNAAKNEWGWRSQVSFSEMLEDMISHLQGDNKCH